jgi:hypothetical protein
MMSMQVGLDARLAGRIVDTTMCRLRPTPGNKVLCTKTALKQAILAAIEEAHEIGFLAGQKEQYAYITYSCSPDRPAWMDIRFDNPDDLARNHIRFQPVVLRSLLGAGYRRLGDLRRVPSRELMNLHYVGFKWAAQIRAVVRRFERDAPVAAP